jgi:hypothetical protein
MQKRIWRNKSEQTELNNKRIWTATVAGNKKESAKTNMKKQIWTNETEQQRNLTVIVAGNQIQAVGLEETNLQKCIWRNESAQTNMNNKRIWTAIGSGVSSSVERNLQKWIWRNESEQTKLNNKRIWTAAVAGTPACSCFRQALARVCCGLAGSICCWFLVCTLLWFPLIDWLVDWLIKWMNRLMNTMFMN